ncbi:hypothetical protein [Streptomyces sp. NPDC048275]|uniref:hypothetical protein n=1 Tax=Bacillati TaxID=1783272 RepID=UPI00340E3491
MKFALVSFVFNGGLYFERQVLFKTNVEELVWGDVVVVKGKKKRKKLGIFVKYIEENQYPEKEPGVLLKKAETNALKKTMKKRIGLFEDVQVSDSICRRYRERFKGNEVLNDEDVRVKIIRNLSVAACRISIQNKGRNIKRFYYGSMMIVLRGNEVIDIKQHDNKIIWIRPTSLKELAEQEIEEKKATGATAAIKKKI